MARTNKEEYNQYMREYMLKRYHTRRQAAIEYLGGKCVVCGSSDGLVLDHIDWREKSFPINRLWNKPFEQVTEELDKCQLLCEKCNADKTKTDLSEIKTEYYKDQSNRDKHKGPKGP